MASLKVETIRSQTVLVADEDALALLSVKDGDFLNLNVERDGRITLSRVMCVPADFEAPEGL